MSTRIVVPAYNEQDRLDVQAFLDFIDTTLGLDFTFVDDGSTDDTSQVVAELVRAEPERVSLLRLPENRGKAEAVRAGLLEAISHPSRPEFVGYFDADLATPLEALSSMLAAFDAHPGVDLVLASRVQLLGRHIERRPARHYAGRVFATFASVLLDMPIYDTQCGAKLFRVGPPLERALAEPFVSGWVFDVELLRRLQVARADLGLSTVEASTVEFPLHDWKDVHGSKVKPADFPKALAALTRIYRRYGAGP